MKKHNEQFEKNIASLVKLTSDSQLPSDNFTNNLINEALKELPQERQKRQTRSNSMKSKRYLMYAASILVVLGVSAAIILPSLNKAKTKMSSVEKPLALASDVQREAPAQDQQQILAESFDASEIVAQTNAAPAAAPAPLRQLPAGTPAGGGRGGMGGGMAAGGFGARGGRGAGGFGIQAEEMIRPMPDGTPYDQEGPAAMFFKTYGVNPFIDTEDDNLSTFAIDVDTGAYTVCRRYLLENNLPPKEAVRVEEFVNYFKYDYPAPMNDTFTVFFEAMPWQLGTERKNTYLMRIGLKALEIPDTNRKPAILTFVIDISGSMNNPNRLGLVKQSLKLLVDKLRPDDQIGIAVYGSRGMEVLSHVGLDNRDLILQSIDSLVSEGSTNAEEGIRIGYQMAEKAFVSGYINRVILCSDGVANVGRTGPDEIYKMIKDKADMGITLSALGFGMGNYNDVLMERLGDKGNGYYAYIDDYQEAERLFSNLTGALQVVARDVKIQVDFNPDVVRSYRLIGYENRDVADEDFRNDTVDGGEIGAGHSTTALYELKLWPDQPGKIATTYIRYKDPDTFQASEVSADFATNQIGEDFYRVSNSFALASVVTEFAEILRESYWAKGADLTNTLQRAQDLSAESVDDADMKELVDLIAKAHQLIEEKKLAEEADIPIEEIPTPSPGSGPSPGLF